MEYFTYPMQVMRITQNWYEGNHRPHNVDIKKIKDFPIDEAGKDGGRDNCYAPVDMKVVKKYTKPYTNAIVLETLEKVHTPIGDIKVYMSLTHPNDDDMNKIKVGQIIKKGEIISREGNDQPSTGNHLHITFGEAPYKSLSKNEKGKYCFIGKITRKPEEICYIDKSFTKIENSKGLKFIILEHKEEPKQNNNYRTKYNMYVRYGAGTKYAIKLVKDLTENGKQNATSSNPNSYAIYKEGTVFTALEIINKNGVWAKTPSGYVCIKGESGTEYCSKC